MIAELKLSSEQRSSVILEEILYQLTIMKQYITEEETRAYFLILHKYGSLLDREYILSQYKKAWGETYEPTN